MLIAIGAVLWLLCVPINLNHAAPFNGEQTGGNGDDEGSESKQIQPEHGQAARQRFNPEPSNGPLRPSLALIYPLLVNQPVRADVKRDKSSQMYPNESGQRFTTDAGNRNSGLERKKLMLHLINSPSDEKQQAIHLTNNLKITQRIPSKPPKLITDDDAVSVFQNYYSGSLGGDTPGSFVNPSTNNQGDSPHNMFQATRAPSLQALEDGTTTKPFERTAAPSDDDTTTSPEPPKTTTKRTMSNAMKAIGFSAIPTIGAALLYGPQWIPALLALAGRRKKRSLTESRDEYLEAFRQTMAKITPLETVGRAAQNSAADEVNPWLALLSGQKYSSGTREQLNDRLSEWRAPNTSSSLFITGRPQRFTIKPLTTTPAPRPSTSATPGASPEQFTSRTTTGLSAEPTTNAFNNRLPGESLVIQSSNSSSKPSSDSFHVLPVSNSGDLDLVAGFVQSTLSKFVDSASDLENEVFVLNTPSVSLESVVTPAALSAPVLGQSISSTLPITANNVSTNSRTPTTTSAASTSGSTTDAVFTAETTTSFPTSRQTSPIANSRVENYTVKPFVPNPVRPLFFNNNFNSIGNSPTNIRKDTQIPTTTTSATSTVDATSDEDWTRPYVLYPDPTTTRKSIPAAYSINPTEIPNTLPPRTVRPRPSTGWSSTTVPPISTTNAPTTPTIPSEYWVNPYEVPNTLPPRTTRVRPSSTLWPVLSTTPSSVDSGNPGQLNIYYLQRNSSSSLTNTQTASTLRPSSLITIQNFFSPMPIKTNVTTTYTSSTPQFVIPVNSSYPHFSTIVSGEHYSTIPSTTSKPVTSNSTTSSDLPTTTRPVTGGAALGTLTGSSLVSDVLTANQKLSNIFDTATVAPLPPTVQQTRPSTSIFPSSASLLTLKYNHSATTNQLPLTTTASVDLTENSTIYSSFYTLLHQISNQGQYTHSDVTHSVTDKPTTTSKPYTPSPNSTTLSGTGLHIHQYTDSGNTHSATDKPTTTSKPYIPRPSPYSTTLSGTGLHIVSSATDVIDLPFDSFNTGPSFSFNIEPNEGGANVEYFYLQNEDHSYESDVITPPQNPPTIVDDFVPVVEPVVAEATPPQQQPTLADEFVPVVEAVVAEEPETSTTAATTTTTTTSPTTEEAGFTIAPQYIFPGLSAFNHQKRPAADLASIVVEADNPQFAVSANAPPVSVNTPQIASSGSETFAGILVEQSVSAPQLSISPLANILNIQANNPAQSQVSSFIPFPSLGSSTSSFSVSTSSGSSAPSLYSTLSSAALPATGFAVAAVAYGAAALAPFWLPFLLSKKRRRNSQGYKKKNGYSSPLHDNEWAASDTYNFANYYSSPDPNYDDNQQVYYKLYDRRERQSKRWRPRH